MLSLDAAMRACELIETPAAVIDRELQLRAANEPFRVLMGLSYNQAPDLSSLLARAAEPTSETEIRDLLQQGQPGRCRATLHSANQQAYLTSIVVLPDTEGALLLFYPDTAVATTKPEALSRQFQRILDQLTEAVVMADTNGDITLANQAARTLLQFPTEQTVNLRSERPFVAYRPDGQGRFPTEELPLLRAVRSGETAHDVELLLRFTDGHEVLISVNAAPLTDPLGRIYGGIAVLRDITEVRRRQREVEEANRQLARQAMELLEANRHKDEFLSVLSHELRTPLTPVLGWVHFLRKVLTDQALQEGLDAIQRNIQAEIRLINDLLDLTRIRSGKLALNFQPVGLNQLLSDTLAMTRSLAEEKNIDVQVELDAEVDLTADPVRLQQVLTNLLTNAIKFNKTGGQVHLTSRREENEVVITVADTGIGIEAEFLPYVFDRFRQADSTTARRFGGLGIGLTIAKLLVERHGGTITAESEGANRGATFTVRLPMAEAAAERLALSQLPAQEFRTEPLRVLIIDDVPDTLAMLRVLLSDECRVLTAESGPAALTLAQHEPIDLVLVDIAMPEMDGFEVFERLRQLPQLRRVPIVALTGFAEDAMQQRIREQGFDGVLIKPIDPGLLKTTLERAVVRKYA